MTVTSVQQKRVYEHAIKTKGWDVLRKRNVEVRDPIHDTITNPQADDSGTVQGQDWYTDLVAAYEFENNADDVTGNGHDGTNLGATFPTGKLNLAADFDGVSSRVIIADHADFTFNDGINDLPFSIATWAYFDTLDGAGGQTATKLKDTFTRADGTDIGNTESPGVAWTETAGDLEIQSNRLGCTSGASHAAIANIGHLGYNNIKAKIAFELQDLNQQVYLRVNHNNGQNDGVGFQIDPRSGTDRILLFNGNGSIGILTGGTGIRASLSTNTIYYAEMTLNGSFIQVDLSSGNYYSLGGSLIKSHSQNDLSLITTGVHAQILISPEGVTPGAWVHEVEVTQALKFEDTFDRATIDSETYDTDIVAAYEFEDNATDLKGANNGTLVGSPTFADTEQGKAITLNGSNQYVDFTDSNDFSFTDGVNDLPFTISLWFKRNDITGTESILSKDHNNVEGEWLLYSSDNKAYLRLRSAGASNNTDEMTNNLTYTAGSWNHIAITYDGSKNINGVKMYLNGNEGSFTHIGTSGSGFSGFVNTSAAMLLGARLSSGTPVIHLNGQTAQLVIIKNNELSAAQVQGIYNDGFTRPYSAANSSALAKAQNPESTYVTISGAGGAFIENQKAVWKTGVSHRIGVDKGSFFGYNNVRFRSKFLYTQATGSVNGNIAFNAPGDTSNNGIRILLIADTGAQAVAVYEDSTLRSNQAATFVANTQYFVEMELDGANWTLKISETNYASEGGTITDQYSGSNMAQSATGSFVKYDFFTNAGQIEIDETTVEQILASADGNTIISKMDRTTLNQEWNLYVDPADDKLTFKLATDNANYQCIKTQSTMPLNTWKHIIVTNDGTGITGTKVYLDGVDSPLEAPTGEGTYTGMSDTSQTVVIGATFEGGTPSWFLDGKLDQLLIAKEYIFTQDDADFLVNAGDGSPFFAPPAPPEEIDETNYPAFITQVKEDHRFIEEGILKAGDAVASFLYSADLVEEDEIHDTVTGKQYEIAKIEEELGERGKKIGKFVALKWVNR